PDTNFSDDGYLEIDISDSTNDAASAVAYDSNGRIVIGGFSATGVIKSPFTNSTWSFARLIATPVHNVGFSGKIIKPDGRPVLNAFITLKSGSKIIANGRTNPFGYFHFKNIQSGQTYTLSVYSKGLTFYNRSVLVDDEIKNYLIFGEK
ncbi:MAG TPA: carboxypeptidase-like regulatory domain-containing protein, partial [Pyrinomonadaceae bacterium]|nr:carboxypeptidase-like regulatory domain-containing protein [Pyrinomonadaceae bacterium]